MSALKRCSVCRESKPVTEFWPNRARGPDARQSSCKSCHAARLASARLDRPPQPKPARERPVIPIGEGHHSAKLSEADVRLIRSLWQDKELLLQAARQHRDAAAACYRQAQVIGAAGLAEKFEVSPSTILKIVRSVTWTHVAPADPAA